MTFFQCCPRLPVPLPMHGFRKQSSSLFSSSIPSSSPCRQADPLKYSRSQPKWQEKGKNLQALPLNLRLKTDRSAFCGTNSLFRPKSIVFLLIDDKRGQPGHNMKPADINLVPTSPRPFAKVISTVHPVDFHQHWQLIPHSVEDNHSLKGNHHGALVNCEQLYFKPFSWIYKQGRNPPMLKPITILLSESILSWPCDIL